MGQPAPKHVDVVEDARRAAVLLHPTRLRLLEKLERPSSAVELAQALGLGRQKTNYHLGELREQGLVEVCEERTRGRRIERRYRRSGESYTLSNAALGALGSRASAVTDRFSAAYQVARAAEILQEVSGMSSEAEAKAQTLPTFAADVDVRFANAGARAAFTEELTEAVAALVEKYHDAKASGGRWTRFYLGAYPRPKEGR